VNRFSLPLISIRRSLIGYKFTLTCGTRYSTGAPRERMLEKLKYSYILKL
jgi:hypothetical protein